MPPWYTGRGEGLTQAVTPEPRREGGVRNALRNRGKSSQRGRQRRPRLGGAQGSGQTRQREGALRKAPTQGWGPAARAHAAPAHAGRAQAWDSVLTAPEAPEVFRPGD